MNVQSEIDEKISLINGSKKQLLDFVKVVENDPLMENKDDLFRSIFSQLSPSDVPENLMSQARKFGLGLSHRERVNHLIRLKAELSKQGVTIAKGNNPKDKDRALAEKLGVRVPYEYGNSFSYNEVPVIANTVIKPYQGCASKAVFFVDGDLNINLIRSSKVYKDWGAAFDNEVEPIKKSISFNRWIVEEAILDENGTNANDMKVYSFYGRSGLYVEIARGKGDEGKTLTCFYDYNKNVAEVASKGLKLFSGTGLTDDIDFLTSKIALEVPVPFLRIDFLKGADGLYLGEITPHPGGLYAGSSSDWYDKVLGRFFIEGEARLMKDLLHGKKFELYKEIYGF